MKIDELITDELITEIYKLYRRRLALEKDPCHSDSKPTTAIEEYQKYIIPLLKKY